MALMRAVVAERPDGPDGLVLVDTPTQSRKVTRERTGSGAPAESTVPSAPTYGRSQSAALSH